MERMLRGSTPLSSLNRHQRHANAARSATPPPRRHDPGARRLVRLGSSKLYAEIGMGCPKRWRPESSAYFRSTSLKNWLVGMEPTCDADTEHDSPPAH